MHRCRTNDHRRELIQAVLYHNARALQEFFILTGPSHYTCTGTVRILHIGHVFRTGS